MGSELNNRRQFERPAAIIAKGGSLKMKCAYCGKERPENEMYEEEIIFRTRIKGKAALGRKKGMYCKETKCGGKDQMAHEG
jgi:hypothetical protein